MKQVISACTLLATLFAGDYSHATDEENRKFLDATAAAVSTAMGRLQSGELDYEYERTVYGRYKQEGSIVRRDPEGDLTCYNDTLKGTLTWQDDSRYSKFTLESASIERYGEEGAITRTSNANGVNEIIESPHLLAEYSEAARGCYRKTVHPEWGLQRPYLEFMDLQKTWFSTMRSPKSNHGLIMSWPYDNPELQEANVENVKGFPRRRRIVLQPSPGFTHGFVIDLDQGGMVIEGWFVPAPNKGNYVEATWNWAQDEHGVWYVTKWTLKRYNTHDADDADSDTLTSIEQGVVTRFDSQSEIPKNRFQFSSLKLASGTRIKHITKAGTSYSHVGGKPPEQKKFDLDSLIDDVQDGFAGPSRKDRP